MKVIRPLGLIALLLVSAGCSIPKPITEGDVISKWYTPAQDWDTQEPVYTTQCTTRYDSTTKSTKTDCRQVLMYYQTKHHHTDQYWSIKIHGCNTDQCGDQSYTVGQDQYDRTNLGDSIDTGSH